MARTPKNPSFERVAHVPFEKDDISPPGETPRADLRDLPRNEAFRPGAIGGPDADPRAGETGTRDIAATGRNRARQDDPDRV